MFGVSWFGASPRSAQGGQPLKRSLMIEWYLPLRAVSFPVLDSPLFFGTNWRIARLCWPLLQPQHPEAAGVCLRIGRAASLVPWQPSLFVGTTGELRCWSAWPLHHHWSGRNVRTNLSGAALLGRWTALFFVGRTGELRCWLAWPLHPHPPKSGPEAVDGGLPPPGVALSFLLKPNGRLVRW